MELSTTGYAGNAYFGDTRIEDGTLQIDDSDAIPEYGHDSAMVVDAGAEFNVNGVTLQGTEGQGRTDALRSLIVNDGTVVNGAGGVATIYVTSLIEMDSGSDPNYYHSGGISTDLTGSAAMLVSPVVASDTLMLSGENNFNGDTVVESGTLDVGGTLPFGLSNASPLVVEGGATVNLGGISEVAAQSVTLLDGNITNGILAAASFTLVSGTISASLNDLSTTAPLTVLGDGTGTNNVELTGQNAYTGVTTINQGATLQLGDGNSGDDGTITDSPSITDNGTLLFEIYNKTIPNLANGYFFYNVRQDISSTDPGPGNLTMDGPGGVRLSGTNTYGGITAVVDGTLQVTIVTALPSGGELRVGTGAVSFAPVWSADAIHAAQASGVFGVGSEIDIEVPFNETVFVTGTPELALSTGANTEYATYAGGSGSSALTFRYIVQPGDSSPALDYTGNNALILNGGTIDDSAGNPVSLVVDTPLSNYETLDIDTVAPMVSNIAAIGAATTTGSLVQFDVTFSKPVYNVTPADFALTGSSVTGNIDYVTGGGTQYVVTVNNVSGTGTLGLNVVDDDSITDLAGNPLGSAGVGNGNFSSGPVFLIVAALPGTLMGGNLSGAEYATAASGTVASFTDTRGLGYGASDYSATIYWADGANSTDTVSFDSGSGQFEVSGSHTYTQYGNYTFQVFLSDPNGLMAIIDGTASIADAPLTVVALTPPTMVEHTVVTDVNVLHFTDANPNAVAGDFIGSISWGDGATSTVTGAAGTSGQIVADPNGGFDVIGTHRYGTAQTGVTFAVSVTDIGGAIGAASQSSLTIADAPLTSATLFPPSASGTPVLNDVPLFSFVDTDPFLNFNFNTTAYSAVVNWGDGSQTTYTNTVSNSPFAHNGSNITLYGSHTYTSAMTGAFSVTVSDPGGSTIGLSDTTVDGGTLGFLNNCVVTQPISA